MVDPTEMVKSIAGGLKGNPSCLAAISLAGMFGILTYFSLTADKQQQNERFTMLMNQCFEKVPRDHGPPSD